MLASARVRKRELGSLSPPAPPSSPVSPVSPTPPGPQPASFFSARGGGPPPPRSRSERLRMPSSSNAAGNAQQAQQQLTQSNAALIAAKKQLKAHSPSRPSAELASPPVASVEQRQVKLALERRITTATSKHVNQLEQRLSDQDLQLNKLHKSLLATEEGCREIADELARKVTPS